MNHAVLAQPAVEPAVLVLARPVVLLDQKVRGIYAVDPFGNIGDGQILALARRGIHEHGARNRLAAEKADLEIAHRADPPGIAFVVDFERLLAEHIEGILQLDVAVDIARKRFAFGILDGLVTLETNDLGILRGHIDNHIRRDALLAILQPFEQIGIRQRTHADRAVLIVDLTVQRRNLELADQVGHGAHGAVAEKRGGRAVDDGNLVVVDLLDILRELHIGGLQDIRVFLRVAREKRHGEQGADKHQRENAGGNEGKRLERLRLALAAAYLGRSVLVCPRFRAEIQKRRQQDNDGDEEPRIDAMDVDRRMEPPIRHRQNKHDEHGRHDGRLLAHPLELLLQIAEVARRIEFDPGRRL